MTVWQSLIRWLKRPACKRAWAVLYNKSIGLVNCRLKSGVARQHQLLAQRRSVARSRQLL